MDSLAIVDGRLPPWHQWWPEPVFVDLVPDMKVRERVAAEDPRVLRSFYDEAVPLPPHWWTRPAVYLQLGPAFDEDRHRAAAWDWPTSQIAGRRLDLLVRPGIVAEQVIELLGRLSPRRAYDPIDK